MHRIALKLRIIVDYPVKIVHNRLELAGFEITTHWISPDFTYFTYLLSLLEQQTTEQREGARTASTLRGMVGIQPG